MIQQRILKVITPGFIDMHSHNDWYLPSKDVEKFTAPFTQQGIATFVGGNCGFGGEGFKLSTMDEIREIAKLVKKKGKLLDSLRPGAIIK